MYKIQKWASGWNHSSLPGQVFKSRKTLIAVLNEVTSRIKTAQTPSKEQQIGNAFQGLTGEYAFENRS